MSMLHPAAIRTWGQRRDAGHNLAQVFLSTVGNALDPCLHPDEMSEGTTVPLTPFLDHFS